MSFPFRLLSKSLRLTDPLKIQISLKGNLHNGGCFSELIFHPQKHDPSDHHNDYIIFPSDAHLCLSASSLHLQSHRRNLASRNANRIYPQTGTMGHYTVCSSKFLIFYYQDTLLKRVSQCLYAG